MSLEYRESAREQNSRIIMALTWKNFFDEDLTDQATVLEFLQTLDIKAIHYQIAKDILKECIRVHPRSVDIVRACLHLVEVLLPHLTTEDMEDWMLIAADSLDIWNSDDVNHACFHMLHVFSKSKPTFTDDISPFIYYAFLHKDSTLVLTNVLPFFMNIISMGSVQLSDEDYIRLQGVLVSVLELIAEETENVHSACFLLRILREKSESSMIANESLSYAFFCALNSQKNNFGSARVCLNTFQIYFPLFQVFSTEKHCSLFGKIMAELFNLFEENLDGVSLSALLKMMSEFLARMETPKFIVELDSISALLSKYTDLEFVQDELMLSDEDSILFLSLISSFNSKLEALKRLPIEKVENKPSTTDPINLENQVSSTEISCPSTSIEDPITELPEDKLIARREEFHLAKNEVSYSYNFEQGDSPSPIVEIEENKVMEMMQLIRHFQEHASISFHRAELLHSLFLESSRKVEELLRENVELRHQLQRGSPSPSRSKSIKSLAHGSISKSSLFNLESEKSDPSITRHSGGSDRINFAARKAIESEKKVLKFIFDGYANRGRINLDGVNYFCRDFGICPVLVPTNEVSQAFTRCCAPKRTGLDFDSVNYILIINF